MNKSYKNQLQEICQKMNFLFSYDTTHTGGQPHCPIFGSKVTVIYNNEEMTDYGFGSTKKKAELSAAEDMVNRINNLIEDKIEHFSLSCTDEIYILIDMENIHMGNFFERFKFGDEFHFIGFSAENHPSTKNCSDRIEIKTIKTDRKDGCDILMIGYTAQLIMNNNLDIIIVTGDHFGPGLVDYIHSYKDKIHARCVKSVDELINVIKRIE